MIPLLGKVTMGEIWEFEQYARYSVNKRKLLTFG